MIGLFVDSDGHLNSTEGNCLIGQIKEGCCAVDLFSLMADQCLKVCV